MSETISLPESIEEDPKSSSNSKVGIIIGGVVFLALIVGAIYLLIKFDKTAVTRDIFIIFLGFELALIGLSTVLLIIQIARLINMFQHEIKPVLEAANETLSTLRGTALFLSDSIVQPAIKINSYFATFRQMLEMLNLTKLFKKE